MLNKYIIELRDIFKSSEPYDAHKKAARIMLSMAKDKSVLFEIIKKNLANKEYLAKKHDFPVIAFPIEINENFDLIAHCWLPLPDRSTETSHQSIHHHGHLLLTSVSAFGTGYESFIFKPNFELNRKTGEAKMKIDKTYQNH